MITSKQFYRLNHSIEDKFGFHLLYKTDRDLHVSFWFLSFFMIMVHSEIYFCCIENFNLNQVQPNLLQKIYVINNLLLR